MSEEETEHDELVRLRAEVALLRSQLGAKPVAAAAAAVTESSSSAADGFLNSSELTREQVERYSRQALLPDCGPEGTRAFLTARAVVVGCGGLGSTAIMFLAASGVGHLVLVDADLVDRSNLHRQIIHTDACVGTPKVLSARAAALALNPTIHIDTFNERFSASNAAAILTGATVVLDCTDNVSARYLINDACVRHRLPLVSGAAMRWDGQLSVYNVPLVGGGSAEAAASAGDDDATDVAQHRRAPTYRCMHPQPPPQAAIGGGCNDIGVFGPVPGIIGCLQALEALKTILQLARSAPSTAAVANQAAVSQPQQVVAGRMLVWDALNATFRVVKMRPRSAAGVLASTEGELTALGGGYDGCAMLKISEDGMSIEHIKPAQVRALLRDKPNARSRRERSQDSSGAESSPAVVCLETSRRLLKERLESSSNNNSLAVNLILDVRVDIQFRLCNLSDLYELPHASASALNLYVSLPYQKIEAAVAKSKGSAGAVAVDAALLHFLRDELLGVLTPRDEGAFTRAVSSFTIQCLCRRGRDSLRAAVVLEKVKQAVLQRDKCASPSFIEALLTKSDTMKVQNISGGLNAWSETADSRFPFY